MSKHVPDPRLPDAAGLFAALGDATRLGLLQRLSTHGPASIAALTDDRSMSRQGVTKHLRVLESAGLVRGYRRGREHLWTPNAARVAQGRRYLDLIGREWDAALTRLKTHVEHDRGSR